MATADKLASQVARRIEAEVIALGWPVGQALDSEPVLRERYGISRSLLREAVRLVEHHQVARMRRGPGGGLIVCAPDVGPATRAAVTYLEFSATSPVDVMRARRLIEPTASRLCAERITEDGIRALRGALKAEFERDGDPRTWAENPLHVIMCNLAGNPAFDLFVEILNQLSLRYVAAWAPEPANLRPAVSGTHRWHAEIVSAVVAGDASRAETRVAEHFAEIAAWMEAGLPDSGAIAPASAFAFRDGGSPPVKPAEVVAARIYDDIMAQGRKIGSVLGSEHELIERYDTSRAVLRAAVRLLEHHSIAHARRGTRGGLVITRPQPRACIDTAALYLAFRGATAADLSHVREAIELGVVADVTARRAQPGIARGLQLLADRLGADPPPGGSPPGGGFHAELAELGANPVLCLFLQIISDLSERIRPVNGQAPPADPLPDETGQVHRGVLDAIREGDTDLAQHRLRRHLGTRSLACEAGSGTWPQDRRHPAQAPVTNRSGLPARRPPAAVRPRAAAGIPRPP